MPIYDALYDHPMRHILMRHQENLFRGRGICAVDGQVGVCFATSGPGRRTTTGLVDALMDSVPVVAIPDRCRST
jgi:acetolactate synthase-1/2/3 large subunit